MIKTGNNLEGCWRVMGAEKHNGVRWEYSSDFEKNSLLLFRSSFEKCGSYAGTMRMLRRAGDRKLIYSYSPESRELTIEVDHKNMRVLNEPRSYTFELIETPFGTETHPVVKLRYNDKESTCIQYTLQRVDSIDRENRPSLFDRVRYFWRK